MLTRCRLAGGDNGRVTTADDPPRLSVCVVCSGNICRSPIGEQVLRAAVAEAGLADRVEVSSAGIGSWHIGQGAHPVTERVLRAFDRHLAHPSLPQTLTARLRSVGFGGIGVQGHAFVTNEFLPDAYGGSLVPLIEQYVAKQEGTEAEATAWLADQRELGDRGEFFFACIQFCFTATRGDRPEHPAGKGAHPSTEPLNRSG